jgi:hypothetical protein
MAPRGSIGLIVWVNQWVNRRCRRLWEQSESWRDDPQPWDSPQTFRIRHRPMARFVPIPFQPHGTHMSLARSLLQAQQCSPLGAPNSVFALLLLSL